MTATSKAPCKRGAYLADEATAQEVPHEPPWVGQLQQTHPDGDVQLITHTGYEWWARPEALREAAPTERDAYDAARQAWLRTPIPGVRP